MGTISISQKLHIYFLTQHFFSSSMIFSILIVIVTFITPHIFKYAVLQKEINNWKMTIYYVHCTANKQNILNIVSKNISKVVTFGFHFLFLLLKLAISSSNWHSNFLNRSSSSEKLDWISYSLFLEQYLVCW